MEVGQLNKKVVFVIQARMKSTRLPGKVLLPIPLCSKKPLLSWIFDELKKSKYRNDIVVATSVNKENDVLVSYCESNGVNYFRGEEENVLSRFFSIVKNEKYDCIVRLTADNPIIDITVLDETIAYHLAKKNDYTCSEGLPVGMNFEVVDPDCLLSIEKNQLTALDKEHVTLFIKSSGKYKTDIFRPIVNPMLKDLRLTLDYASDYALLSVILSRCENEKSLNGIKLIESTFDMYPWLFESNSTNYQKKQYATVLDELEAAAMFLEQNDFFRASNVLRIAEKGLEDNN